MYERIVYNEKFIFIRKDKMQDKGIIVDGQNWTFNAKALLQPGQDEVSGKRAGHRYRWLAFTDNVFADFERGKIVIKHISTHAECDKLTDLYRRTKE